jgi:23S rRNA (cytosine1962-C5)-methyltransferase
LLNIKGYVSIAVVLETAIVLPSILDFDSKDSPFQNSIRKNYRHIKKWAARTSTNAFRIYDREIGFYPVSIDYYAGKYQIQFFSMNGDGPSQDFKQEIEQVLHHLLGAKQFYWKYRIKRERLQQYEKVADKEEFFEILEYGVKFWINLEDYLDTGLFLDHREIRQFAAKLSPSQKVLNLFCYTSSFSLHCAMKGAVSTTNVDLSNTYLSWGMNNFKLNKIDLETHRFVREDCLKFLKYENEKYDLIIIDPPTLSRSKKMESLFEVQEEYPFLINQALRLLAPKGTIIFSTNLRSFRYDAALFPNVKSKEITDKTFPLDFHKKNIHRCWTIQKIEDL